MRRFTAAAAVLGTIVLCIPAAIDAFQPATNPTIARSARAAITRLYSAVEKETAAKPSKKDERLRMMKSDKFFRQGFKEVREDVEKSMSGQFKSGIVDDLKASNYVMERDGVKVYLAKVCL